jgi:hypothetical protein
MQFPLESQMLVFIDMNKSILKFIWKHKAHQRAKAIFSRNNNAGDFTIHDIKLYYRTTITKTAWCWHKRIHEDKQNTYKIQK